MRPASSCRSLSGRRHDHDALLLSFLLKAKQHVMHAGDMTALLEGSNFDTCAICLDDIGHNEAFLDNCYHRFHQQVSHSSCTRTSSVC